MTSFRAVFRAVVFWMTNLTKNVLDTVWFCGETDITLDYGNYIHPSTLIVHADIR